MNFGKKGAADKQKLLTSQSTYIRKKINVTCFKVFILCIVASLILLVCGGIGIFMGIIDSAPDITLEDITPQDFSTTVYDQNGTELIKLVTAGSNRDDERIQDVPKYLQDAFVAIEDARFYKHNGIDLRGIGRAIYIGVTSGDFSEGASTITQQLLKNNVFEGWIEEKNFIKKAERKIQEQYLALKLEKDISKEAILENYMNSINLGQNTLGVKAACRRYFDKDTSEINLSESAVIAAIPQNPSKYNPISSPEKNAERRVKVLKKMLEQNLITEGEYNEALQDNVYDRISAINAKRDDSSVYTYFIDELTRQVIEDLQKQKNYTENQAYKALYSGGLSIYATQNAQLQKICDDEYAALLNDPNFQQAYLSNYQLIVNKADGTAQTYVTKDLEAHFKQQDPKFSLVFPTKKKANSYIEQFKEEILIEGDTVDPNTGEKITLTQQPQSSVVLMDQSNGSVEAIVGGIGQKQESLSLNRASSTKRQPGSTFKIVSTYAPALDTAGMTLASVQDDAPYNYSNGKPIKNANGKYNGLTNIRYAITQSTNIVAVKTLTQITPRLGFDYLQRFGFTSLSNSDIVQSLALGGITNGVTNLQLTASFAAIANNGTYIKPRFYTKILDRSGNVLLDNAPQSTTVLKASTSFLLTDAMQDVLTEGTGTKSFFEGMPIAGKTGTTSNNYDIWFTGYTPYYTCSVWGGYDPNGIGIGNSDFARILWRNIMSKAHQKLDYKEFKIPNSVKTEIVCKKCGNLAVEGLCEQDPRGSMAYREYFAEGTVPTEVCNCHVKVSLCKTSQMPATEYCPAYTKYNQVFIVRPKDASGTTDDSAYEVPSGQCTAHTTKPKLELPTIEIPGLTKQKSDQSNDTHNLNPFPNSGSGQVIP